MNRKILTYELIGIIFIIILGAMLHFTYEFSGNNPVVGAFSAVNESVWEHIKLAIWPTFLFALIELKPLKNAARNFWIAKTIEAYFMVALIPLIFYSYTAFTGEAILSIDISSFVVTVILGQLISYKFLTHKKLPQKTNWIALALLIILAVTFVVFTFITPQLPIFQDSETGLYGIAY